MTPFENLPNESEVQKVYISFAIGENTRREHAINCRGVWADESAA